MSDSQVKANSKNLLESGTIALFLLAILLVSLFVQGLIGTKQSLLFLIGVGLGMALLHALFGFTGGWRKFIRHRKSDGVRAQILLLMLTSIFFFPILGGSFPGIVANGAVAPVGYSILIGAFLFGIGMQLGGGCGSGTLFTMGQGQIDMLLTLTFFIIGATLGSSHLDWWFSLGDLGTISLIQESGWVLALFITLVVLVILYIIAMAMDRQRNQQVLPVFQPVQRNKIVSLLIFGRWPLWWAVIIIAVLNLFTMLLAGHPWSITYAFSLWGTKIWTALGGDISGWAFWQSGYPAASLERSVLQDTTSLMNFGLILGAGLAATLAGRFAPETKINRKKLIAIVVGGLLLGYGARLAFGCNIGALLAGISSGSVHGWLWLVAAFIGNIVGTRARIVLGLDKA